VDRRADMIDNRSRADHNRACRITMDAPPTIPRHSRLSVPPSTGKQAISFSSRKQYEPSASYGHCHRDNGT
jgi:hypothetical protein